MYVRLRQPMILGAFATLIRRRPSGAISQWVLRHGRPEPDMEPGPGRVPSRRWARCVGSTPARRLPGVVPGDGDVQPPRAGGGGRAELRALEIGLTGAPSSQEDHP